MSNVNANINITVDNSQALGQIRALQSQISSFNKTAAAAGGAATAQMNALNKALADAAQASGMFSARIVPTTAHIDRFSDSLDKGKLSLSQYARGIASQMPGARKVFEREFDTISKVAEERVKKLQTQYVALGNAQKALALQPTALDMGNLATQTALASQKQMIMNKMIADGSTKLVNWGKNTQWAGRQLMVGFTMPLTLFGATAAKVFMDLDRQARDFKRVYGDVFTPPAEIEQNLKAVEALALEYTKYGVTVKDTMQIAATAAAAGMRNQELMDGTQEALRLATIGQIDYNQALDTTISLQTAFQMSNEELAPTVDFLGAVANQTVLTIDDMTKAIPRVAPVIQGLGGDVKDLAAMLVAMREGGVSAENAANGLKSGLASLINPTNAAQNALMKLGIDIKAIVAANRGDLMGTINEFATALSKLNDFERQQALEKTFGKYQYARLGALFDNIIAKGGQAEVALTLAGKSAEELGALSAKSLKEIEESTTARFEGALERLKVSIAPIGESFLKALTPILEFIAKIADKFNNLPDVVKNVAMIMTAAIAGIGPIILMTVGLIANGIGNLIKFFQMIRKGFATIRGDASAFNYLAGAELDAAAAAASLEGRSEALTGTLLMQEAVVQRLVGLYQRLASSANAAARSMPTMLGGRTGGKGGQTPIKMARGGVVPGSGSGDKIPALLEPGESVVTKKASQKYGPVIAAMNAGTLPGYEEGLLPGLPSNSLTGVRFSQQAGNVIDRSHLAGLSAEVSGLLLQLKQALISTNPEIRLMAQAVLENTRIVQISGNAQEGFTTEILDGTIALQRLEQAQGAVTAGWKGTAVATPSQRNNLVFNSSAFQNAGLGKGDVLSLSDFNLQVELAQQEFMRLTQQTGEAANSIMDADIIHQRVEESQQAYAKGLLTLIQEGQRVRENLTTEAQFLEYRLKQMNMLTEIEKGITDVEIIRRNAIDNTNRMMQEMTRLGIISNGSIVKMDEALQYLAVTATRTAETLLIAGSSGSVQAIKRGAQRLAPKNQPNAIIGRVGTDIIPTPAKNLSRMALQAGAVTSTPITRQLISAGDMSGNIVAQSALTATRNVNESRSPAEAYARVMDDAAEGMVVGAKRSSKTAGRAGKIVAQSARAAYRKEMSELRRDLRNVDVMERGGMKDATMQTRTLRRLKEAEARKEKARQSEVRAAEQSAILAQRNARLAAQTNAAMQQQSMGMQEQVAAQGGGRMSRLRSRFGGGRMAGVGMGLMGVGMMAPMLPGQAGEIGSKIQPALMAISTLSMLGPLLGALLNPIGLLVVGVAAAAAGVLLVKKMGDDVASKGKELAQAMNGTAQSMKDTAAFFGNKTWKEKLLETQIQAAGGKVATTEEKTQAQGYLESEAGQKLLSDIQMAREFGGTEMATTALQNQLKTMLLSGSIAPDMAIAIAQQIGTQLGSQDIAIDTTANLIRIVGADGRNLLDTDGRMKIIADIMADGTAFQNAMEQAGLIWDGSGWFSQVSMILSGAGTADIFAENLGAQIAAQQQIMSEEFSRLDQLFKTGKISVDEYTSSLSDLSTQLELTSYESMLSEAYKTVEGFDESAADRFGQSIVDGLRKNLSMTSLGAEGAEDFINNFKQTVQYLGKQGIIEKEVNLFDPEAVREAIDISRKQGKVEQANLLQEQFNATMNIALKIDSGELNAQDIANMIASGKKPKDIVQELGIKLNFPDKDTESLFYGAMRMVEKGGAAARLLTNYQATGDWKRVQELSNLFLEAGAKGLNVSAIFDVSGEKGLEEALDLVTKLDKIPTPITKEAVMKFLQVEDPGFWNSITGFENLKDYQVKEFVSLYRTLIANPEQISSIARAGAAGVGEGAIRGLNLPGISVADQEVIANQELINQVSGMEEPSDNAGTSAGGGGGDKELSGLQELWKNITEKLRLYTNFTDLMQKYKGQKNAFAKSIKQATYAGSIPDQLRQMNLSESLIADILEKGSKEARRILNALKTRKGLADQMSVADIVGKFGEATSQMVSESKIAQAQVNARGVLRSKKGRGVIENILGKGAQLTADEEQSLLSNEAVVNMINAGKFNKKQFTDFIAGLRSLSISESEMQSVDEILQSFIDKKRLQQEVDTYENKQIIKGLQDQLELIDRQIQSIEKKNEKDRQTIRGLERQKEMIQRQIDAIERQNELDQRRINNLKREDEIRNRVSEALSHELDIMGQQEQKIRESYEKRTQALEKVRSINEQITRQQQDQLNISRALASGDIYEATAAAQQMQQNQIGFAQQQTGQALQQGMENQIAGLRTESGLTRQQAEEQIRSIKEQSYQTSLLIQGIEDKIYERNLQIIPLKDAIYNIDLQIQAVNDQIYNRETEILNIQNNQRDPLLEKLQTEQDILDAKNEQYENEIGTLELAMAREKLAQTEINNANTLASIWRTIADQIADANKTMKKELTEAAGSAPQRQDYETSEDYSNAVTAHQNKLAGIRQRRDAAVAAAMERGKRATARGGAPETAYAGGYMDKRYAAGNYVLGSGGRDSIPAMLTPGEFVIRKAAVDKYGVPMLNSINMGAFRTGGPRYNVPDMFAGGTPRFNEASPIQMDAPVYNNYNVNVNVAGTNASADEIATRAIMKIKEMQNMQIRGNRAY